MESKGGVKLEIFKAFLALIVGILVATFAYNFGKVKGSEGKKPGFDQIPTQLKLDKTKWGVTYDDMEAQRPLVEKKGIVEFEQQGSRVTGEAGDETGRKWIIEGATAERRVCYIYYDSGGQQLSFGTVILTLDNTGTTMTGQWTGWAPESDKLQPRKVTLRKLLN
jgi:hypothetical protein